MRQVNRVPMKAVVVQDIATELRRQLFKGAARKIEVPELVRRAEHMKINGREVRFNWDIAHAVHGKGGESVLGICEYDPQEPRSVMISIHSELVQEPELFRSTTAHELAHAIFDMPAGLGGKPRRVFRTRHDLTRSAAPIDWREWRANEFMGTFLVPYYALSKAFARCVRAPISACGGEGTAKYQCPRSWPARPRRKPLMASPTCSRRNSACRRRSWRCGFANAATWSQPENGDCHGFWCKRSSEADRGRDRA